MARARRSGGFTLRVIDRRPTEFVAERVAKQLRIDPAELGTLADVRDVYLVRDGEAFLHGCDVPISSVRDLWRWWTDYGLPKEYDYGTPDPTRRFPADLPGV